MKKTAIGFQGINGKSHVKTDDNINSGKFIEFFTEVEILNSTNEETKEFLEELLAQENVQDKYIPNNISQRSKNNFINNLQDKIDDNDLTKEELAEKLRLE